MALSDFKQSGGDRATERLIALPERPDGVLIANGVMAIGALEAMRGPA